MQCILVSCICVVYQCVIQADSLTVVDGKEGLGVVGLLLVLPGHVLGQQVEGLVPPIPRHLLTVDHL